MANGEQWISTNVQRGPVWHRENTTVRRYALGVWVVIGRVP